MRTLALAILLGLPAAVIADTGDNTGDSNISGAETSYTGAQILQGDRDVTIGSTGFGTYGNESDDRYAFFSGNTLYLGVEDVEGNAIDSIIEFFWFESSIDRGSDFYVAVVKMRTTPAVDNDWYLETSDMPVIYFEALTDIGGGSQAFRWDWSIPFENYGIDSYGDATLTTSYGIGTSSEGSAIMAETYDEDGVKAEAQIQAKGYLNADYKVNATYQVTLYRWDVTVRGSPDEMRWQMSLNTSDRDEQSAYHEFFLVMQAEEETPFTIETLDLGAGVQNWWTWSETLGVSLANITIQRPEGWESALDDTGTPFPYDTDDPADDSDEPDDGDTAGETDTDDSDNEDDGLCGCSSAAAPLSALWLLPLGLGLLARRRED
jgi:hypothetical protein